MTYNATAFETAHKRFLVEPKNLTDDDLAQFAAVDPQLAERARARRSGFVEAADDDSRTLAKRALTYKGLVCFFRDHVAPILATHRYKAAQTTARLDELAERCFALEARVLELEASAAARETVPR
jgi:hypothetical protein